MNIEKHDKLWSDPADADYLVTFSWGAEPGFNIGEIVTDSERNLAFSLAKFNRRGDFRDDSIDMLRVEFGTGLVASAFGAELMITQASMPAVLTHPIQTLEDLERAGKPDVMTAGYLGHIYKHIEYYRANMLAGFYLVQPDMQGPWNNAQLLVGDKIFFDIFDDPKFIEKVLEAVVDFSINAIRPLKKAIGEEDDYFYIQGTRIPGAARLCNCSTDMISPDFYEKHLFKYDNKFFEAMNGGMMHICGNNSHCIGHFNKIEKLRALEINFNYLDVFKIADMLREDIVLLCTGPVEYPLLTPLGETTLERFCKGEFPDKRNILFHFNDPCDLEKCKKLYGAISRA